MAPIKMKQVAPEKNMKVRSQFKRVKVEMKKIREDQQRIRKEQIQIREKQIQIREGCGEIKRQCDQLKEETEMIKKQAARNQSKLDLMFQILKAQKDRDFTEAAALTHSLRKIVGKERANASLAEEKDEEDPQ